MESEFKIMAKEYKIERIDMLTPFSVKFEDRSEQIIWVDFSTSRVFNFNGTVVETPFAEAVNEIITRMRKTAFATPQELIESVRSVQHNLKGKAADVRCKA